MSLVRLPSWAYTLIAVLPALAFVLTPTIQEPALRIGFGAVVLVWLVAFTLYAWVRLDEPSREAHKFAWFWGGAPGLVVIQLVAVGAVASPLLAEPVAAFVATQSAAGATPEGGFFVGVFSAAIFQIAGYGLVWTCWWLSKRAGR